jgi:hypothetical protein
MERRWNDIDRGNPKYSGKNPGSNPGLRGERPATNLLSHGRALYDSITVSI